MMAKIRWAVHIAHFAFEWALYNGVFWLLKCYKHSPKIGVKTPLEVLLF